MTDVNKIAYYENFDGKSGNLKPQIDGFSSCDNGTIVDDHGHTWIEKGDGGWSRWGFSLRDDAIAGLRAGDEIWFRVAMKFPTDFDFKTAQGKLKCFRIGRREIADNDKNRGYIDWYIKSGSKDWSSIVEYEGGGWRDHTGGRIKPGEWQTYEVYAKLHPTDGIMRIWCDGVLFGEAVRPTISVGSNAGQVERLLHFTWWNDESPKTQGIDFDEVAVAVRRPGRNDTAHMSRDAAGNHFIGLDTADGEVPVDPPVDPGLPVEPPINPPVNPDPPSGPIGPTIATMTTCDNCVYVHTDLPVIVIPLSASAE